MTSIVEVAVLGSIWLTCMNIIGTRTGDAMTLNFGTSGSRIECSCCGTAATSGLINLLVRPLVWVSVQGR